jgi:RHS repeat-associated protein
VSHSGSSSSANSSTESYKTQTNTGSTLNQGLESALPEESSNPWLNNLNEALSEFGEDQLTLEETQKDLPTIESIYPDLSPTTSYKTTTTTRVIYWYHPDYIGNVDLVSDNSGEAYEFFLYNPWGENLYEWNSGTASFSSPYRFNGKELDAETGLAYYGARYYDNQTSMWLSVDPLGSKRSSLTSYNFLSNNPIMRIDPNGKLDGDFYSLNGIYLGTDGISDGRTYLIMDKDESRTIQNNTKQGQTTNANELNSAVLLPSKNVREEMAKVYDMDEKDNSREYGGLIIQNDDGKQEVWWAKPGKQVDVKVATHANIDVFDVENRNQLTSITIVGTFHSHPSATAGKGDEALPLTGNSFSNMTSQQFGFVQSPSSEDIQNASVRTWITGNSYVLGARDNMVYIYNGNGLLVAVPKRVFTTIGN